ncbi:SiaB family protein kinase [Paenibacillus hexagrammi]|uniref:SiaB family protein kinase n=1 Tax=Paenibacillus hexagrammi TaxID=2908839 RepID=A0ABY3SNJ3_9BACL|nr:SiaB family protein kinase [Paenibacillus sp. YPD9-1]UJF34666.1 SiaB family protein kinase [Paenibacillus sp. YPD9-1]
MIHSDLFHVHNMLQSKGILISFSGRLSQGLIEEYGEAVKRYMELDNRPKTEIFHIFSIFIEQTQNIKNYCTAKATSSSAERIEQSSIVTIGKWESGNYVCCGNLIENGDMDELVANIQAIIDLDKEGLRKLYKEKLRQELPEGQSSAGIGLIEMARKASCPLEYSITPIDDQLSFFTLKAVV